MLATEHRSSDGATALHFAALTGHLSLAELLITSGCPVDVESRTDAPFFNDVMSSRGMTPLHAAAFVGDAAMLARLLRCGADMLKPDATGRSVLRYVPPIATRDGGVNQKAFHCVALLEDAVIASAPPGAERCGAILCSSFHGHRGVRLKRCARCRAVAYCCEAHQREAWQAGHKGVCALHSS